MLISECHLVTCSCCSWSYNVDLHLGGVSASACLRTVVEPPPGTGLARSPARLHASLVLTAC